MLTANQQNNGANGGYTPPNYLQYRTPTGPPGGSTRPAISPPAMTGTGMYTPGFGGYNPSMTGAPAGGNQVQQGQFLGGGAPQQPTPNPYSQTMQAMLGQLAAGQ